MRSRFPPRDRGTPAVLSARLLSRFAEDGTRCRRFVHSFHSLHRYLRSLGQKLPDLFLPFFLFFPVVDVNLIDNLVSKDQTDLLLPNYLKITREFNDSRKDQDPVVRMLKRLVIRITVISSHKFLFLYGKKIISSSSL